MQNKKPDHVIPDFNVLLDGRGAPDLRPLADFNDLLDGRNAPDPQPLAAFNALLNGRNASALRPLVKADFFVYECPQCGRTDKASWEGKNDERCPNHKCGCVERTLKGIVFDREKYECQHCGQQVKVLEHDKHVCSNREGP